MHLLDRLPYDLLRVIFEFLDVGTLLNACLAGHNINEVASWVLYTSITFNPDAMDGGFWSNNEVFYRNPIEALERRPQLRNAVRNVTLCTSRSGYYPYNQDKSKERMTRMLESCHEALTLIPNVAFLRVRHYTLKQEWEMLSKLLPQLRSLRILDLYGSDEHINGLPDSTATDIHTELSARSVLALAKSSMAHKVRTFATAYDVGMTINDLELNLRAFSGLTRLSITRWFPLSQSEICQLVAAVPSLHEALFVCDLQRESGDIVPTGTKNLTYLRITFLSSLEDPTSENKKLKRLVQCITEQSRLQRLDIVSVSNKPKVLNGDPLLSHILPLHGRTLKKLKIPNYRISRAKLGQLLSQCGLLTSLWFGVAPELKAHLPELLSKSTSLEKLRIFADGTWRFMYAQGLLCQTCPTLRELKVCAKHKNERSKACWKGRWKYDDALQKPMILVEGPHSASFRAYTRQVQYAPSYTESVDEDEDDDDDEDDDGMIES